ncbi:MAG: type VI secretion system ATPase TssH [Gemmatimonadota bacterium]|jgi:type VI secretion system protein VasG
MNPDIRSLVARLNPQTRSAVENAAGLCVGRTHYDVEVEHFLRKLLDDNDGDTPLILHQFGVDRSRLVADLDKSLDSLKTGNARTPSLSPSLVEMLSHAWQYGSLEHGATQIRSGFTLVAMAVSPELRRMGTSISPELDKISGEKLRKEFSGIVKGSAEEAVSAPSGAPDAATGRPVSTAKLDQYTQNLTARAKEGQLDPVLGRDFEIRQVVDILTRRRQNNPILVGEAGVGKTAVVEGFAMRVAEGDVPDVLKNVTVRTLDLALLQAGAGVKGEFENRLKGLIEEVKSSPAPIILFIDEAHTMIGAGGAAGQGDAANLLKPALARGELRTIAATTWSEYKKYFEKDPALARRFQLVKVDEPEEELCKVMMRGVVPRLEMHHGVRILEDGMEAAVHLSARYLSERQLPDKAVSVLDTACARLALGQGSTPASVEAARRRLDDLAVQTRVLEREAALGADHGDRLAEIAEEKARVESELTDLTARWEKELSLVGRVRDLRKEIEEAIFGDGGEPPAPPTESGEKETEAGGKEGDGKTKAKDKGIQADLDGLKSELGKFDEELRALQGENPLIPVVVDSDLVGQVISGWTGIPVGKMMRDEMGTALSLEQHLGSRIIGQDHAMEVVSHRIRTSFAKIEDPKKPKGVFLFVGPSGVGKTETALALADLLYGGERNLVTINMSEFQEAHTVSTLKGSPPGYVGYGEGGVLTEAVRRRPYSVVLLDEIEKAHPDVLELFFQVFDKGQMEDGEGRRIDFKNTIIVLTTNAGTDTIMKLCEDPETMPSWEGLVKALKPELDGVFKPAFLGRTVIVPYFPVRDDALKTIVRLKLGKIVSRLQETHRIALEYDDTLIDEVAARCTEVESGARNIDNILTNTLLPDLSRVLLQAMVEGEMPSSIQVSIGPEGAFSYSHSA